MKDNIYLVGFMGAGKSSVGLGLSHLLGRKLFDMDEALVSEFGRPIHEVMAEKGEAFFRSREKALLKKLAGKKRQVVATGGGAFVDPDNRALMAKSGRAVFLDASFELCRARLSPEERSRRPMWRDEKNALALFEKRRAEYGRAEAIVSITDETPEEAAQAVISALNLNAEFAVRLEGEEHPVFGTFNAPAELSRLAEGRRVFLLADAKAFRLHGGRLIDRIQPTARMEVRPGERSKTLAGLERVYKALFEARFERSDLLVAFGGGMVTDLGALAAATYKRGLDFILVSTTLLGAVDAAVGGKAAVNLGSAKNIVGSFTVPEAVILDYASFGTLGRPQVSDGLVEAYKTGLVACPELAELIEAEADMLKERDRPTLARVAGLSARTKAEVVAGDFRESGRRAILNFGHTYGHAVEALSGFKVSHGRAVAAGMKAALRLSLNRGLIGLTEFEAFKRTVDRIAPSPPPDPDFEAAWDVMGHDKKIRQGRLVFVLIKGAGSPVLVDDVTADELKRALEELGE